MRYFQGSRNLKLCFVKDDSNEITGYCDDDLASDPVDRRSCMSYTFLFQNACLPWNSSNLYGGGQIHGYGGGDPGGPVAAATTG